MPDPRFILVGHCIPDAYALRSAITSMVPDAMVEFVNDAATLAQHVSGVFLVNRKLDGDFGRETGLDLIRRLASEGSRRVMLISNLEDAQSEAQAAGALPGFGKEDLYSASTRQLLVAATGA